jgi:hypothetical protein
VTAVQPGVLLLSLALALFLALTHLAWRRPGPSSPNMLSLAGGVSAAYIFLDILPALVIAERLTEETAVWRTPIIAHRVYALALLGVVLFYTLQKGRKLGRLAEGGPSRINFSLTLAGHAAISILVGYLLVRRPRVGAARTVVFALAMFAHFVRYDSGLRRDYGPVVDRIARRVLALSVLVGWLLGVVTLLPWAFVAGWMSVLAGAIILTALREEVPEEKEAKPGLFALGAAIITLFVMLAG